MGKNNDNKILKKSIFFLIQLCFPKSKLQNIVMIDTLYYIITWCLYI